MNPTFRSLARTAILSAALISAAAPAFAQNVDDTDQAPRMEIKVGGIDLTTQGGFDQARKQVNQAARSVCQNVVDPDGFHIQKTACVQIARTQGVQQLAMLQQKALAAAGLKTVRYAYSDPAPTPMHKAD